MKSLKTDYLKKPVTAQEEIKASVSLANKCNVKAKSFVVAISFYGN